MGYIIVDGNKNPILAPSFPNAKLANEYIGKLKKFATSQVNAGFDNYKKVLDEIEKCTILEYTEKE